MNTPEVNDYTIQNKNTEYFEHLIRVAKVDNIINGNELELLRSMGKMLGFSLEEVEDLIETTGKSDYIPPNELFQRFEQVYGIVKMTLADGSIDKDEMRFASSFAIKSGFSENAIPKLLLLLIDGVKQDKKGNELFELYKKGRNS